MAGGATALAQAALMSKQGVASSIEKQEVQNQRLAAQGQLQVDLYKGQGELNRMKMQETREKQELDRLQAQADQQLQQRISSTTSAFNALGDVGSTLAAGLVPSQIQPKVSSGVNMDILKQGLTDAEKTQMIKNIQLDPIEIDDDESDLIIEDITFDDPTKTNVNNQQGIDPRVDMNALNSPVQVVRMLEKQRLINEGIPVPAGY